MLARVVMDWFVWLLLLTPPGLILILVWLYILKKRTDSQGWRRSVPRNAPTAFALVVQGVLRTIGRILKKIPWKPLLIWGPWVTAVLVLLFYGEENWRGGRAWKKAKADWEARGEKLTVEEFLPPPIPDEENFAKHPAVLAEMSSGKPLDGLRELGLSELSTVHGDYSRGIPDLGKRVDFDEWLVPAERTGDSAAAARRILELLAPVEPRFAGIAEAARRPACRYDLGGDSTDPLVKWHDLLCYRLMGYAKCYYERGLLRIRAGDGGGAMEDLETVLLFVEKAAANPLMIGAFIQAALLRLAEAMVWDGLLEGIWDEGQLERIEDQLSERDLPREGLRRLRCEAAYTVEIYSELADGRSSLAELWGYSPSSPLSGMTWSGSPTWWDDGVETVGKFLWRLPPSGWYRGWMADDLKRLDRAVLRPEGVSVERLDVAMIARMESEAEDVAESFMGELRAPGLMGFGGYVKRMLHVHARVDLMRVAVALERFRLRTGEYPTALEELVPTELAELPRDQVNGEALRYRIKEDGTPLIYGVGLNEVDDGGVPARKEELLDWVWQYTATPGQSERMWGQGEKP